MPADRGSPRVNEELTGGGAKPEKPLNLRLTTAAAPRPDRFPDAPHNIRALPRDARGFPVPWFTPWIDGEPCFQAADGAKIGQAAKQRLCWICGKRLGDVLAFVIGPMCAVNRISSEPPSHWLCAVFSAKACPFLTKPRMRRMAPPEGAREPPGIMIERNPGVTLVWATSRYHMAPQDGGGALFEIGPPRRVAWFAEGREATRAEVMASIESGFPLLRRLAEEEGEDSMQELRRRYDRAMQLLPKAA